MDLNTKPGSLVRFLGENGYEGERKRACALLTVGNAYEVESVSVGRFDSSVRLKGIDAVFNTVMFENDQNGVMPTTEQADNSVSAQEGEPLQTTRERVADAIAEAIGLDAYDCTRTWAAWSVGIMSQDDFVEVVRDQDRINEIADAAIAAMQQSTQARLKSGATQAETQADSAALEQRQDLRDVILLADWNSSIPSGDSVMINIDLVRRLREHALAFLEEKKS